MTILPEAKLIQAIADAAAKAAKHREHGLGEQDTKASLIEPVLEALGWHIRDPDEVQREFRPKGRDKPVDYALKLIHKPRLFLEAKGLGGNLTDRKWIVQVIQYAAVAGVEWCVLTDGDEYRFYNATELVDAESKMFRSVKLSDGKDNLAAQTLNLISRANMEENLLDDLWKVDSVDRRVKAALTELLMPTHKSILRLVRRKVRTLSPKEVSASLNRLDIRIVGTLNPPAAVKRGKHKATLNVTLRNLIGPGLLKPPVPLYRRYKGNDITGTVLADGAVDFAGNRYETCSAAAGVARGTITGSRMETNGWVFWQFRDGAGQLKELDTVRRVYVNSKKS